MEKNECLNLDIDFSLDRMYGITHYASEILHYVVKCCHEQDFLQILGK